jgi:hypothetical protein
MRFLSSWLPVVFCRMDKENGREKREKEEEEKF